MEQTLDQTPTKPNNKSPMFFVTLGMLILFAALVLYFTKAPQEKADVSGTESKRVVTESFRDGTYSSRGSYVTHVGDKFITVTLTLKDNVVTDSTVVNEADDPISVKMQNVFIDGYKEFVVGKKISDIHLSKISGSSLTPIGFNDALEKIKEQAKI